MSGYLYGFEAKEIQTYVFRSAKLRDMAGGSELVNRLCEDFLDDALNVFSGTTTHVVLSRGAGGARVQFADSDAAGRFRAAWPLLVEQFAPGVRVVQAVVPIADSVSKAVDDCREALRAARNSPVAILPEIGPLIDRSPLTGAAGVRWWTTDDGRELLDRDIARRRSSAVARTTLLRKLEGSPSVDVQRWPTDFDQIATSGGENAYLAVVHADGNDLGAIIGAMLRGAADSGDSAVDLFSRFSRAVETANARAAQEAFRAVLCADVERRVQPGMSNAQYAGRPIVLGGDDLTIVLRADLALGFLEVFLEAFERESAAQLQREGLHGKPGVPACLTACGGIAFVKKAYPFHRAYGLCESLCAFSKREAKAVRTAEGIVPSCFTFHRVTASLSEDFEEIKERELTGVDGIRLHAGPYAVGAHGGAMRRLQHLINAAALIGEGMLPGGSVRKLVSELYRSQSSARAGFARMLQVNLDAGVAFRRALEALGGDLSCAMFTSAGTASLLPDVHAVRSLVNDSEAHEHE